MSLQHIVLFSFPRELTAEEDAQMRAMVASWPGEDRPDDQVPARHRHHRRAQTRGYSYLLYTEFPDLDTMNALPGAPRARRVPQLADDHDCTPLAFDYAWTSTPCSCPNEGSDRHGQDKPRPDPRRRHRRARARLAAPVGCHRHLGVGARTRHGDAAQRVRRGRRERRLHAAGVPARRRRVPGARLRRHRVHPPDGLGRLRLHLRQPQPRQGRRLHGRLAVLLRHDLLRPDDHVGGRLPGRRPARAQPEAVDPVLLHRDGAVRRRCPPSGSRSPPGSSWSSASSPSRSSWSST